MNVPMKAGFWWQWSSRYGWQIVPVLKRFETGELVTKYGPVRPSWAWGPMAEPPAYDPTPVDVAQPQSCDMEGTCSIV